MQTALVKMRKGRPRKGHGDYTPDMCDQAREIAALGKTNTEIAAYFGVERTSIWRWERDHPEFKAALDEGRAIADGNVIDSLYKRARGFEHSDKYYPPDTTACIFWLKNRLPDKWRDKQITEHEGNITILTTNYAGSSTV